MDCRPIGIVETPYTDEESIPRQGFHENAAGRVVLDDDHGPGLVGFEVGDRVLVLWVADRADRSVIEFPERDGGRGVFTTRSPARPNPIGLTPCLITDVGQRTLSVRGVDMISGSPVLDLKPPLDLRDDWTLPE